jgi:hypothetical protein
MWGAAPTIMKIWERGHPVRIPALFAEETYDKSYV